MGVGPSAPWGNALRDVEVNGVGGERNGAENLDAGETHQAHVTVGVKVGMAGEELVE